MEGWIKSLVRNAGAILAVFGAVGFIFAIGTIQGMIINALGSDAFTKFLYTFQLDLLGVFIFGIAVGAGSTSAILIRYVKVTETTHYGPPPQKS